MTVYDLHRVVEDAADRCCMLEDTSDHYFS